MKVNGSASQWRRVRIVGEAYHASDLRPRKTLWVKGARLSAYALRYGVNEMSQRVGEAEANPLKYSVEPR